jgi:hypothetical protein
MKTSNNVKVWSLQVNPFRTAGTADLNMYYTGVQSGSLGNGHFWWFDPATGELHWQPKTTAWSGADVTLRVAFIYEYTG